MGGPLALDDRHLMWGHNNQPKVVVDSEGVLERRRDRGGTCGGRCPIVWGVEWSSKKKKNYIVALDGRQLMIYYATTNQKQASLMEGDMKERCDEREVQGKHYAIVLGALLVDRRLKI
jgi:hypothetical protein